MALRVLVLHGPNLNLGDGTRGLEVLEAQLEARATALGVELATFQANGEGALLDELHRRRGTFDVVIVNPSSIAPVAYGLADGLKLLGAPAIEVLLEHESKGRGKSALRAVVSKQFHGKGFEGYLRALEAAAKAAPAQDRALRDALQATAASRATEQELDRLVKTSTPQREGAPAVEQPSGRGDAAQPQPGRAEKTIGRDAGPRSGAGEGGGKTLGRGGGEQRNGAGGGGKTSGRGGGEQRSGEGEGGGKTLGRGGGGQRSGEGEGGGKTLGRGGGGQRDGGAKTLGRAGDAGSAGLTRAEVKRQLADRLARRLAPDALAAWARTQWQAVQSGATVEGGQRELLDEVLLALSGAATLTDDALISVLAKLG